MGLNPSDPLDDLELPPPPPPGKGPLESVSSGLLEAGSGQNECSQAGHLALDPLISVGRSRFLPSPLWCGLEGSLTP